MSDFFILQITFFHLLPPAAKSENHTNNRENLQGEKEELVAQSHVKYIKTNKQTNKNKTTEKYLILQVFVLIILNISRNSHCFKAHFSVALRQRRNHFSLWKHCIPLPTWRESLEHRSKSELCDYTKLSLLKGTDFSRFLLLST